MNRWGSAFWLILSFFFWIYPSQAQESSRFIYLGDDTYQYIDYLINSGQKTPDFVFQQPYDMEMLQENPIRSRSYNHFLKSWQRFYPENTISGQLAVHDQVNYSTAAVNRYQLAGSVHWVTPHATFANRTIVDQDYKYDPNYAGDLSESKSWIYGRVNDAYMQLRYEGFGFFAGRISRNWGPIGAPSLFLSDNPYTYDHFLFSYTYKQIKLSLIVARLEDLKNAYETDFINGGGIPITNARKFITGHRLDIQIMDNLQIALSEMATYGGEGRDFEFAFLNPMNFYYGIQRNDKKPMSGLWALDLFYKPVPKMTLYGQFLIDDIVVNNEPGVDDRAQHPDRLGLYVSARSGDLVSGLNTDLSYTRIWNRTYQSKNTYENYHYRELGLGYPDASCEEIKLKIGYWGWFPIFVQNETIIGRYGDVAFTDLFPLEHEPFPVPEVTKNLVNILRVKYFVNDWLDLEFKAKYADNPNHYLNRLDQLKGWSVSLAARLLLAGGFDL